jgi:hypothetical protein
VESHVADHEAHSPICSFLLATRASPISIPLIYCAFGDPWWANTYVRPVARVELRKRSMLSESSENQIKRGDGFFSL